MKYYVKCEILCQLVQARTKKVGAVGKCDRLSESFQG